jgi:hypothetical protein
MKKLGLLTIIFFNLAIIANAQTSETKVLETRQYQMKSCIRLWFEEKTILNQTNFLQAIRNDAGREKCLQDLEKVDFTKNSLSGIQIDTGYCRYPFGLKFEVLEDSTKKEVNINVSYLKPDGVCRALSQYDLWLLLPKIPTDYQVKYKVFATEKLSL